MKPVQLLGLSFFASCILLLTACGGGSGNDNSEMIDGSEMAEFTGEAVSLEGRWSGSLARRTDLNCLIPDTGATETISLDSGSRQMQQFFFTLTGAELPGDTGTINFNPGGCVYTGVRESPERIVFQNEMPECPSLVEFSNITEGTATAFVELRFGPNPQGSTEICSGDFEGIVQRQ